MSIALISLIAVILTWAVCMPIRFRCKDEGKMAVSLTFKALPTLFAAACAGYALFACPTPDLYAKLIFAGLCVSVAADVLLDLRFEIGGGLFFCAHVLYVMALSQFRGLSWWCLTVFLLAAVALEAFITHYQKEVPTAFILLGLRIYALALAALLGFGLPLPFLAFGFRAVLAALGAAAFVASDLTLCHNTIRHKPNRWHYVSLGVYYAAQLMLGLSALPF